MSQYIANLNTDSPPEADLFNAHDDLTLFAQTEFFDWDMGDQLGNLPADFEATAADTKAGTAGWQAASGTSANQFALDGELHYIFAVLSPRSPCGLFAFIYHHFVFFTLLSSRA